MFRSDYPFRRGRLFGEELLPIPRSFQRAIDSMLQDVWEPAQSMSVVSTFSPQIDVDEDEKQVKIMAELPGLTESDVEIVYEPGQLILRGEKKEEEKREYAKGRGRYEERRYGSFERRIPLRAEVEEGQIQANFDRGVLTICLPKSAEARAQARKIPIKLGAPSQQIEQSGRGRQQPAGEGAAAH
ncbi:MAG: Hsp20/alpha crystallin family protein [Pseudomonadota bacterium]